LNPTANSGANDTDTVSDDSGVVYYYEYTGKQRSGTLVREGSRAGNRYYLSATDYGNGTTVPDYLPIAVHTYPAQTDSRTAMSRLTTTMAYTFWDVDLNQPKTVTTTPPTIDDLENGSEQPSLSIQYFDRFGQLRWTQDPD